MSSFSDQGLRLSQAPSFVRQSLLGRGRLQGGMRNLTASLPPPILTLPAGMDLAKLVGSVVDAYKIAMGDGFWRLPEDELQRRQYAYKLMDKGFDYTSELNYRAASDIFSLCVLIYPNYYFDYLLAMVRFRLRDYTGSLKLLDRALEQIRARQGLDKELAFLAKEANFGQNFYCFYVTILLFNHQKTKAASMVEFILQHNIVTSPTVMLSLLRQYRSTDDRATLAKIAKTAIVLVSNLGNEEVRSSLLQEIKNILSGK